MEGLSPRYLTSSGSYPLGLFGMGDPTGSNATTTLSLRVTETQKSLQHNQVNISLEWQCTVQNFNSSHAGSISALYSCECI